MIRMIGGLNDAGNQRFPTGRTKSEASLSRVESTLVISGAIYNGVLSWKRTLTKCGYLFGVFGNRDGLVGDVHSL